MKICVIFILLVAIISCQTVNWIADPYFRLSNFVNKQGRYDVLVNKYCHRWCTFSDYIIPHTWGNPTSRQILSITRLDFTNNGASLGLNLKLTDYAVHYYKFSLQILNETVLHNLKIDCLSIHSQLPDYYSEYGWLECKILSKGEGYRSQNYSIPILTNRYYYNYDISRMLATVYLNSFLVFNPQGQYVYLNWKMHMNKTHYTIQFETNQKNIVTHIGFDLISTDLQFVQIYYFYRLIQIETYQCPGADCPGTGGFDAGIFYTQQHQQFWGMSGFNFTKSQEINWYLKTTSFADLSIDYIQSSGIKDIQVSGFIVAHRICADFDLLLDEYFDPATLECTTDCSLTANPYPYPPRKLCVSCYYQCQTCNDFYHYTCTACNPADNRWAAPYYSTFSCPCLNGYVDVGTKKCKKCSELMPGCTTCNNYNLCLTCQPGLQPSTDKTKCQCIDSSKFLTRTAECIDIDGCLNSLNGTAGTKLCIECDLSKNSYLTSFKCECLSGYVPDLSQSYLTCIEQCGNKIITVTEQCDDGNTVSGDGCSNTCLIEQNYDCFSNYTDASFCILNFTFMRHYETLKILDQENTAEVYFTFQPYFQKYFDHMNIFKSLFNSSSLYFDDDKFTDITYEFINHQDKEIRFKIRFKYHEKVNQTEQHYVRFFISDTNRTHYLTETLNFTLKSKNYPLYLDHETQDMHETLSYVLLSGIIVGYLFFFISLLSESWIGIQLMNTLQWIFMYFFLLDNVESCLSPYINILKLSLGYNKITDDVSPYVHYNYHDQLLRFGYVKQFFLNFNFSALLFAVPLLMIPLKLFAQWRRRSQSLNKKAFTKIKKKQELKSKKQKDSLCDWFKNKNFLSFDFIIGRLMLSFVMVNLLQSIFSFFIQLSPWFELDDRQNNVLYTLYMYGIILLQLGVCSWVYIEVWERLTFDSQSVDPTHRRVFKFDGFKYTYPLVYIFIQVIKIICFVLSFEENICLFVMMGCDGVMLMFYIFYRPYTKSDQEQQTKGYFIHNLHNIWNCLGLTGFLVLVYFVNKKKEEEVQSFSGIIIYCVIGVCYGSLLFTLIRLLQIAGVFEKCLNKILKKMNSESDKTQNSLTQIKLQNTKIVTNLLKEKTKKFPPSTLKTQMDEKQLIQQTLRKQIVSKIKGRFTDRFIQHLKKEELVSLQKSKSSRTTYKKI